MTTASGALVAEGDSPTLSCGLAAYLILSGAPTQAILPAIFSDDIFPNGGSGGWYDHAVGVQDTPLRGVLLFDMQQAPKGELSKVELGVEITYVYSNDQELYNYGPYGTYGRNDPRLDSGITRWQRADVSTNPYRGNQTDFRTTGVKWIDLGATALIHVQSIIDYSYQTFAVAMMQLDEVTLNSFAAFAGYASQTPNVMLPKLRLTYVGGKIVTVGLSAYVSVGGAIPKSISCSLRTYIVPYGWMPEETEDSPWTIESPEDGASLIIP